MENKIKVLVIDDDEIVRITIESLLTTQNVEIILAEDGEEGIQKAQKFLPDAILLDVMMPRMDGYETCLRLRANPQTAEIPIFMVTALDDRDSRLAGFAAGADDFIAKPFDSLELQIRIKNITRINRYRNLLEARSRFYWVVDDDEKGYLLLDQQRCIQYANQRAQVFLHLPENYIGLHFDQHSAQYYQKHRADTELPVQTDQSYYFVQAESPAAHAFWLRVEMLEMSQSIEKQQVVRLKDVTEEMATYQDVRKIHVLIAHKLRTPVNHMYASISMLEEEIEVIPDSEVKPLVKIAALGASRLNAQILEILEFIDAPITLAKGAPFYLNDLHGAIASVQKDLGLNNVAITIPSNLLKHKLSISAQAMALICSELLDNAQKFHPNHTPHIQVIVEPKNENTIQIQFLDNGQILTAEQINRAKRIYVQSEKWFTGEVSGMGLGIPLVATLVWQSGGQVRIANRDDQAGMCVSIVLPMLP